ncbi:M15 family metallopeptidase, partial [bacterium]|nr:M15 family metallopeptidase [bacterium]
VAIDINPENNGLYNNCIVFNKKCKLIQGGVYNPENIESITKDSIIYKAMIDIGFKWGGEIKGKQKDFMHFSPDGY